MRTRQLLTLMLGMALVGLTTIAAPGARAEGGDNSLVMVLDSSGSMKEKAADGKTKIAAAKSALTKVVGALPDEAAVGMRVYGATVFDREDKGACQDTQLVVPIGTDNRPELTAEIKKYKPYGETPIAYSLEQAAKDLGSEGQRTILLVSDGEETCVPDPCPVAEKIAAAGIDLKIDVVGLDVSGKAREQLTCVADKGRGDYYDADSTEDLEESLSRLSTRAFRPFRLSGKPVKGAADPASAPKLAPGDWTDKLPASKEATLYYRVPRSMVESTFWVGLNLLTEAHDSQIEMIISPVDDPDTSCGYAYPMSLGSKHDRLLLTGSVSSHSDNEDCTEPNELLLAVTVTGWSEDMSNVPFQLRVSEESPVAAADSLPPEDESDPVWSDPEVGKPTEIVAGSSFADAPEVAPGTYALDVMPGEVQVFKVPADWGQRVQALVTTPQLTGADAEMAKGQRQYRVGVLSPQGAPGDATFMKDGPEDRAFVTEKGNEAGVLTKEIRWSNRDGCCDDQHATALAGDFYLTLQLERTTEEQESFALPMTMTVDVLGEAGKGAPQYVEGGEAPADSPSPEDGPSADDPSAGGPGASPSPSASASSAGSTEPSSRGEKPRGQVEDEGRSWGLVGGLVGGAVLLGGLGAGGIWWLRRRP